MSREIQQIINAINAMPDGERAILATVVELKGSGYRLPGARMLIAENGNALGTVSGGCLEADVMERARRVMNSGRAELFTYDTTSEETSVFSLNMGCRGVMRILIERVEREHEIAEKLAEVYRTRKPIASAVVITSEDPAIKIGSRVYWYEAGGELDDWQGLMRRLVNVDDDLKTFFGSDSVFESNDYVTENGVVEIAFEMLRPPVQLLILGAGADAVPLAEAAKLIGWQVKVYDHRPAFLTRERFPKVEELAAVSRDTAPEFQTDTRTAIVSMNHNYDRDREMLAAALRSDAFYIAALGPKKRTQQILEQLEQRGEKPDESRLAVLRSPAGLDIGGDDPETIALSIIAEIQSVLKHREGGPLMRRTAPIYDRT